MLSALQCVYPFLLTVSDMTWTLRHTRAQTHFWEAQKSFVQCRWSNNLFVLWINLSLPKECVFHYNWSEPPKNIREKKKVYYNISGIYILKLINISTQGSWNPQGHFSLGQGSCSRCLQRYQQYVAALPLAIHLPQRTRIGCRGQSTICRSKHFEGCIFLLGLY